MSEVEVVVVVVVVAAAAAAVIGTLQKSKLHPK
jgi:type II secretory pathway pseudopilin PulG